MGDGVKEVKEVKRVKRVKIVKAEEIPLCTSISQFPNSKISQ